MEVLYVDDGENDLILTQLACKRFNAPFKFALAATATEALDHLNRALEKGGRVPDLILLDLVIGPQSGFEVLGFLRTRPALAGIPVVVFTGMKNPRLLRMAQELGANGIVEKTGDLNFAAKLIEAAKRLGL